MQPKSNMVEEAVRIVDAASENDITLRIMGGVGTRLHCEIIEFCRRDYSDIDMVGLSDQKQKIATLFEDLGYKPDKRFNALHGYKRLKFEDYTNDRHIDIFLDRFDMDHDWDLSSRLQLEEYTLPVSDLLLMKLQICKINEKDIQDILTMLKDAKIGEKEASHTINITYIAKKCSQDWGLYESVLENLNKIHVMMDNYDLTGKEEILIKKRLENLTDSLITHKKTAKWRLRAAVGKNVQWCQPVEE